MKDTIISQVKEALEHPASGLNLMGCSEAWYNPYYAIGKAFPLEELEEMGEIELLNLKHLAETIAEGLY